jgi:hypothetical protein
MNIQLIRVEHLDAGVSELVERPPVTDEYEYTSIAIEEGGCYYYWAKGISLEISKQDYEAVKINPKLYYFSTALRLHIKIDRELLLSNYSGDQKRSQFDADLI